MKKKKAIWVTFKYGLCFSWLCHSPIHVLLSTLTSLQYLPPTTQTATTTPLQCIGIVKLHHRHCGCRRRHRPPFISFLRHLPALLTGLWGSTQNTWPHQEFGYFDLVSHTHWVLLRAQMEKNGSCCTLVSFVFFYCSCSWRTCNLWCCYCGSGWTCSCVVKMFAILDFHSFGCSLLFYFFFLNFSCFFFLILTC